MRNTEFMGPVDRKGIRRPLLYFGLADLQMEPFVTFDAFRVAFLWNLLFHGKLAILDGYWFTSRHLMRDISMGRPKSLALAALERGLALPWFRQGWTGERPFENTYNAMRDGRIIGLIEESSETIASLDATLVQGTRFSWGDWGQKLIGSGFRDIVKKILWSENPPVDSAPYARAWTQTKKWRLECVERAITRTDDGTLRRGDLFDLVGRDLGWSRRKPVPNTATLMALPNGGPKGRALEAFVMWVNHCYQLNHSQMFSMDCELVAEKGVARATLLSSLSPSELPPPAEAFTCHVKCPRLDRLLGLPADRFLDVCAGTPGQKYFACLDKWRDTPSEATAQKVCCALKEYTKELCKCNTGEVDLLEARLGISPQDRGKRYLVNSLVDLLGATTAVAPASAVPASLSAAITASTFLLRTAWGGLRAFRPDSADFLDNAIKGLIMKQEIAFYEPVSGRKRGHVHLTPEDPKM